MPQENSSIKEKINLGIKEPGKFNVVFHNDDFTPMDFVVMVLVSIFYKDLKESEELMMKVHNQGKAIIGTYSYDIARSKAFKAVTLARENGYPLRISVQQS